MEHSLSTQLGMPRSEVRSRVVLAKLAQVDLQASAPFDIFDILIYFYCKV